MLGSRGGSSGDEKAAGDAEFKHLAAIRFGLSHWNRILHLGAQEGAASPQRRGAASQLLGLLRSFLGCFAASWAASQPGQATNDDGLPHGRKGEAASPPGSRPKAYSTTRRRRKVLAWAS